MTVEEFIDIRTQRRLLQEVFWECTLRLPNLEMQALLGIEIVKRYQKGYSKSMLVRLMEWMFGGDAERLEDGLSSYLERVASTFDTAKGKEAFYHGFITAFRWDRQQLRRSDSGFCDGQCRLHLI